MQMALNMKRVRKNIIFFILVTCMSILLLCSPLRPLQPTLLMLSCLLERKHEQIPAFLQVFILFYITIQCPFWHLKGVAGSICTPNVK